MKKHKFLALGLAAMMSMSVFAGCGQGASTSGSTGTVSSGSAAQTSEEPTEIIWMVRNDEPKNYDAVMEAVNERLLEEINMTLDLHFIASGDYDTKMQMAMAGGDDWDLCFTASWANNYVNAAGKGALLELTPEMLNEYAPNMMSTIPEKLWDGIKVNGSIYALMNYQVMYDQAGMQFLKSAVEEQNIDVTQITDWDSLNAVLGQLAEAYPDKYATRGGGVMEPQQSFQEYPIPMVMSLPFLMYDEETQKIDNTKFFDLIEPGLQSFKLWKDNNWVPADAATMKDENTLLSQGMFLSRYQRVKPGVESALLNNYGNEWVVIETSGKMINTNAVQSTLTGVNINSKHPEKAIQLYDYIFGNEEISNMLFYGLEGQDYELVNGRVKRLENCWNAPAWQLGNQFNAYLTETDEEGVWEATMQGNEEAALDPLFGFVPDRTPIETELATCEAVWLEYKDILYYGLKDYTEVIPEMMSKLEGAGLEKVTTELQNQIDAFLAAKA